MGYRLYNYNPREPNPSDRQPQYWGSTSYFGNETLHEALPHRVDETMGPRASEAGRQMIALTKGLRALRPSRWERFLSWVARRFPDSLEDQWRAVELAADELKRKPP